MKDKLKEIAGKAKQVASSTGRLVGDLNGDGKVDGADAQIAADWAKKTAAAIGDEASKLGKEIARSDMAKDAAAGAAIGAAVAIPVPVIGPLAGAAIGASLGIYKNVTSKGRVGTPAAGTQPLVRDLHAELLKLDDLRQKKLLTDAEFEAQKKKSRRTPENFPETAIGEFFNKIGHKRKLCLEPP